MRLVQGAMCAVIVLGLILAVPMSLSGRSLGSLGLVPSATLTLADLSAEADDDEQHSPVADAAPDTDLPSPLLPGSNPLPEEEEDHKDSRRPGSHLAIPPGTTVALDISQALREDRRASDLFRPPQS